MGPRFRSVLHPSDFSHTSELAFRHALAITLLAKATLTLLHVQDEAPSREDLRELPSVRGTLESWGMLPAGSHRHDVSRQLGIQVSKVAVANFDIFGALLAHVQKISADLIVLAAHRRHHWWQPRAVATPLVHYARTLTLFIPQGARGFVAPYTGSLMLRRILLPVTRTPSPHFAFDALVYFTNILQDIPLEFVLLHVGDEQDMPLPAMPHRPHWVWLRQTSPGAVVDTIVETARNVDADLIVMATQGQTVRRSFFRGSTTERVVRQAPCPVLVTPAFS